MEAGWVAQWEYNRSFDVVGHFPDDVFRECLGLGRCADEDMGLGVLDDGEEVAVLVLWPLGVFSCEGRLGWCQLVAHGLEQKTWFIQTPGFAS